jgi:hydrogenase large subunit
MAVTHYLEALDLQKEIVKIHTIFGGKNPHPNWLVGGVPCPINVHSTGAVGAINMERLNHVAHPAALRGVHAQRLYPGRHRHRRLLPQLAHGGGLSSQAVMSLWRHPRERQQLRSPPSCTCPPVRSPAAISRRSTTSMCATPSRSRNSSIHSGTNTASRAGPASLGRCHRGQFRAGRQHRRQPHAYPRDRRGGEVFVDQGPPLARQRDGGGSAGPLHRGLCRGHERITDQVTGLLRTMDLPVEALFSTLGRTAARALEAEYCAELQQHFFDKLMTNIRNGDESTANIEPNGTRQTWPAQTRGVGFTEAPRGALGHWVTIRGPDRELPMRRSDHLERQPPRQCGQYRGLRGGAAEHADGAARGTGRDPAHAAQLRPLPCLFDPCDVS